MWHYLHSNSNFHQTISTIFHYIYRRAHMNPQIIFNLNFSQRLSNYRIRQLVIVLYFTSGCAKSSMMIPRVCTFLLAQFHDDKHHERVNEVWPYWTLSLKNVLSVMIRFN